MEHAEGACLLPTYIYLYVTDTRKAFIATMACCSLRTDDVYPLILKPIKKIFLLHPLICSAACQSAHPIDPSSQSTFTSIALVVTSFLWTHWTATLKDWPDTKLNLDFPMEETQSCRCSIRHNMHSEDYFAAYKQK
jgi:hypothetical protein